MPLLWTVKALRNAWRSWRHLQDLGGIILLPSRRANSAREQQRRAIGFWRGYARMVLEPGSAAQAVASLCCIADDLHSALERAAAEHNAADGVLDQALLEAELAATVPLSVTMAESLARLRQWCQGRAVHAGA